MQHDVPDQKVGDKVRIKVGDHKGKRGLITTASTSSTEVALDDGNAVIVNRDDITNFSLAARKAWQAMPKKTGRPKMSAPKKRMISIRVDVNIVDQLELAVKLGLVTNKEATINSWLQEKLSKILEDKEMEHE